MGIPMPNDKPENAKRPKPPPAPPKKSDLFERLIRQHDEKMAAVLREHYIATRKPGWQPRSDEKGDQPWTY